MLPNHSRKETAMREHSEPQVPRPEGPQEVFEEHDVWLAPATTSGTFYFEARVYWRVQYL